MSELKDPFPRGGADLAVDPQMDPNFRLGLLSALAVLAIWSGFLVVSRAGMQTSLTAGDITMLRFAVTGLIFLPFARAWWPRQVPFWGASLMAIVGPGALYSMLTYLGLGQTSAAHGGVFTNGAIPLFTLLVMVAVTGLWPGRVQLIALLIVMAGGVLFALPGLRISGMETALGIVLLLLASALVSIYIFCLSYWNVTPRQALVLVNVPNALLFLPLWGLFLPSGLAEADVVMIVFQAAYQALGPGVLAVVFFALSATHLGPALTAGFSAAVPVTAALLALPVLGEALTGLEWVAIGVVTLGLLLLVRARAKGR
ncbi:MAG: DMT family transporter [Pseudomonadota bacterium]